MSDGKVHSKIGASGMHRWGSCAGSVALSELMLPSPSSDAAREGTLAHEVLEKTLNVEEIGDLKDGISIAKQDVIEFEEENSRLRIITAGMDPSNLDSDNNITHKSQQFINDNSNIMTEDEYSEAMMGNSLTNGMEQVTYERHANSIIETLHKTVIDSMETAYQQALRNVHNDSLNNTNIGNTNIENNNIELDNQFYDATFDIETIEQVLKSFNESYAIEYTIENNKVIIN